MALAGSDAPGGDDGDQDAHEDGDEGDDTYDRDSRP